ncbi:MAG: ABC transporter permease [Bifidobacteriaceae bacterium]|jgi:peptide/nickel transport system permease protein|nr:ABC transporter permease [Bifidobacteriaceae bacterium]
MSAVATALVTSGAGRQISPATGRRTQARRLFRMTERRFGIGLLLTCALASVLVPALSPWDTESFATAPLELPSLAHPFGADQLGRDVLTRTFAATGIDLAVTVIGVTASLALGTLAGLAIVVAPRRIRSLALRLVDAFLSIPYILLVIILAGGFATRMQVPGVESRIMAMLAALVLSGWAPYARFTVSRALALRERESVVAAKLLGYSAARVLARHMAPAVISTNLSYAATQAVGTVGTVASLAFLGLGVAEPTPELGQMMQAGIGSLPVAWWVAIIPGLAVLAIGTGFGLIADSLGQETMG